MRNSPFALLAITYAILIAENSIYSDLRDEVGDRQAGVRPLATYLGLTRTFATTFVVAGVWAASITACFVGRIIDAPTAAFAALGTLGYPFAVWLATRRSAFQRLVDPAYEGATQWEGITKQKGWNQINRPGRVGLERFVQLPAYSW